MKQVEPRYCKPGNLKIRQFKLGIRNFINKYTGQDELIEQYNAAMSVIAKASDASKSSEFKKKALAAMHAVEGGETVTDGVATWEEGTFNPYTPMQKKALRAKIVQLHAAIQELGISR